MGELRLTSHGDRTVPMLVCSRCGVTAAAIRVPRGRYQTTTGEDARFCEEAQEKVARGESAVLGQCSELDKALREAIESGVL